MMITVNTFNVDHVHNQPRCIACSVNGLIGHSDNKNLNSIPYARCAAHKLVSGAVSNYLGGNVILFDDATTGADR